MKEKADRQKACFETLLEEKRSHEEKLVRTIEQLRSVTEQAEEQQERLGLLADCEPAWEKNKAQREVLHTLRQSFDELERQRKRYLLLSRRYEETETACQQEKQAFDCLEQTFYREPVSYTHLDVYKRQILFQTMLVMEVENGNEVEKHEALFETEYGCGFDLGNASRCGFCGAPIRNMGVRRCEYCGSGWAPEWKVVRIHNMSFQ